MSNNTTSRRMAGTDKQIQQLESIVKPWSVLERGRGKPTWHGRSEQEFLKNDNEIVKYIRHKNKKGRSFDDIAQDLIDHDGFNRDEAIKSIREVVFDHNPHTRQVNVAVPNAAGDEYVSRILGSIGGRLGKISPNNTDIEDPYFKTDLKTDTGLLLDTQRATRRAGNVGVKALINLREDVIRGVSGRVPSDITLRGLIEAFREEASGINNRYLAQEDKLLQSRSFDLPINTEWYTENNDLVEKDALLTMDRSGFRQPDKNSPFRDNQGSYDPQLPKDMGYLDLSYLRDLTMDKPINNLPYGMRADIRSGSLTLDVPKDTVRKLTEESGMIDPRVTNALRERANRQRLQIRRR